MAIANWNAVQRRVLQLLLSAMVAASASASAREGVEVGERSVFADIVSAEQVEQQATLQYQQTLKAASEQRALGPADNVQVRRLRAIAQKIIPLAGEWNERARQWKWEVNLIGSNQINAFCMPGGKIVFYTGILKALELTDDEVAMVMGHEIAHALREHARERMGKSTVTSEAARLGGALLSGWLGIDPRLTGIAAQQGANLLTLKFGREDESEADLVGMELAARAGFDPRAGVSLWQKMSAANKGAPPQWLSTHPSGNARISEIEANLPKVMPLYERAKQAKSNEPRDSKSP
ncbi:MAG: M48 family metallopeptidase [Rhodoferax sp.]|nr:M48 family metallopeptidase [Rhodoferax sp.]